MKKIDETNQIKINKLAWAYLITFRTYNSWSHGDKRTSVERKPMALWYDKKVYDAYDIELYKAYFDR